ncbi:protein PIMREG isoform X1 [Pelodiscus sinensis]|uniref:protein PIMREG isoform X1 n=1 Tax=Pelodiscus sinensis TaxID=13735 RepID=UPI003F6C72EA
MASVFHSVGATIGWRNHQPLADFENESPVPDKFRKKPSSSALNTLRMSLRKRMPLKQVEMNFREHPTWESLEAKEKHQTFRTITRSAKNAFGTVSQASVTDSEATSLILHHVKSARALSRACVGVGSFPKTNWPNETCCSILVKLQKSCQSHTQCLVTSPAKAPARRSVVPSSAKRSTSPRTPHRKTRLATVTTPPSGPRCTPRSSKRASLSSRSAKSLVEKERRSFAHWLGKDAVPLRRSRRAAALKSPYSSPLPASRKRQVAITCISDDCVVIVARSWSHVRQQLSTAHLFHQNSVLL